jgi:hypothetical protein
MSYEVMYAETSNVAFQALQFEKVRENDTRKIWIVPILCVRFCAAQGYAVMSNCFQQLYTIKIPLLLLFFLGP